jgi:hypothetical protein
MAKYSILKYPRLLELSLRQENSFWSTIFENLAYGKSPYGCYVTNSNFLVGKNKGSPFTYDLNATDKSLDTLNSEIKYVLTTNLNLMSKGDKVLKIDNFNRLRQKEIQHFRSQQWQDIRRKSIRDILLEMFVVKLSKIHSLSFSSTQRLISSLIIAFMFKRISNENVKVENFEIVDIKGLTFGRHDNTVSDDCSQREPNLRSAVEHSRPEADGTKCSRREPVNWFLHIDDVKKYADIPVKQPNEKLKKKWLKLFS